MQLSPYGLLLLTQPLQSSEQHIRAHLEFSSNFAFRVGQVRHLISMLSLRQKHYFNFWRYKKMLFCSKWTRVSMRVSQSKKAKGPPSQRENKAHVWIQQCAEWDRIDAGFRSKESSLWNDRPLLSSRSLILDRAVGSSDGNRTVPWSCGPWTKEVQKSQDYFEGPRTPPPLFLDRILLIRFKTKVQN